MVARLVLTAKQEALLTAAVKGSDGVALKPADMRNARTLVARGCGALSAKRFIVSENGKAALMAIKDRRQEEIDRKRGLDLSRPETWGNKGLLNKNSRDRGSPIESLHKSGLVTDDMMTVASQVVSAFQIMTGGSGYKTQYFGERVDQTSGWTESASDYDFRQSQRYQQFREVVFEMDADLSALINVLVFEVPFRELDRSRHKRNGWVQEQLINVLAEVERRINPSRKGKSRKLGEAGASADKLLHASVGCASKIHPYSYQSL